MMKKIMGYIQDIIRRIKEKYVNLYFRGKLFLVFLLVAILPTFIFQYYSYSTVKDQLVKQTFTNMNNTINQINRNIDNTLDSYMKISATLYMDSTLQGYLVKEYVNDADYIDAYYDYINRLFTNLLVLNGGIDSLSIYTNNTSFPSDGKFILHLGDETFDKNWNDKIMKASGTVVFGNVHTNTNGLYLFSLARLLDYKSNGPYGILRMDINLDDIYSLIANEGTNKEIYIIDSDGTIITYTDKNKDKSLISKNFFDVKGIRSSALENSGSFDVKIRGVKTLVIFSTTRNGWKTVSLIPYSSFLRDAQLKSAGFLIISLVGILLATILIFFTSDMMTKRIKLLVKQIKKLEKGNFDISLKNMGHDEVGQLAEAFTNMSSQLNILIKEVYEKEILRKKAEMDTLQAQINPHFLYNTLSSISSLAIKQNDMKVNEMVNYLARFYRISLNKGKKVITVKEEIEMSQNYVAIQQIRFQDMLHVHFDIDESLYEYKTIKLILQPFIENCINHAIWDDNSSLNIIIKVHKVSDTIYFEIIDDGAGMSRERLEEAFNSASKNSGYGVKNVNERIKLHYGEEFGVTIFSRPGIGTNVQISIPAY